MTVRVVLAIAVAFQIGLSGVTGMGRAAPTGSAFLVICTAGGLKTVRTSDLPANEAPRSGGCHCPCAMVCGECLGSAPVLVVAGVRYELRLSGFGPVAEASNIVDLSVGRHPGGARSPPHISV